MGSFGARARVVFTRPRGSGYVRTVQTAEGARSGSQSAGEPAAVCRIAEPDRRVACWAGLSRCSTFHSSAASLRVWTECIFDLRRHPYFPWRRSAPGPSRSVFLLPVLVQVFRATPARFTSSCMRVGTWLIGTVHTPVPMPQPRTCDGRRSVSRAEQTVTRPVQICSVATSPSALRMNIRKKDFRYCSDWSLGGARMDRTSTRTTERLQPSSWPGVFYHFA